MARSAEAMVGAVVFLAFLVVAVAMGAGSGSANLRAFSFLAGVWGGGALGVFAGLAMHLARGEGEYHPIEGKGSAWGLAEYDQAGGQPPESR